MPRRARVAPGGVVYHVLNRAVARHRLFDHAEDYAAFERVITSAHTQHPMRILAYCVMPNHWHMVLWPSDDGDLSAFVRWLTHTHAMRWHAHRGTTGTGHLYQGRFKSFPIQTDAHFLTVCRYVERNALRAGLVARAEQWRWCSLWRWRFGSPHDREWLHDWPVHRPRDWLVRVNRPEASTELEALRRSVQRGSPYGSDGWQPRIAQRLGLEHTLRPRGRPKQRE